MARAFEGTTVPVERSREQIETMITKAGGARVSFISTGATTDAVLFWMRGTWVTLPVKWEPAACAPPLTRSGVEWSRRDRMRAYRLVHAVVKVRLEAIRDGYETFQQAFLPYLLLPTGETVGEAYAARADHTWPKDSTPPIAPHARVIALGAGTS